MKVPVRTAALSCVAVLLMVLFNGASSLAKPPVLAAETEETTCSSTALLLPTASTADNTMTTDITRMVTTTTLPTDGETTAIETIQTSSRTTTTVQQTSATAVPQTSGPSETESTKPQFTPFVIPPKNEPTTTAVYTPTPPRRINTTITLPGGREIRGLIIDGITYIYPEDMGALAEVYGGNRLHYVFSPLQAMKMTTEQMQNSYFLLQGIALGLFGDKADGSYQERLLLWYDEDTINQPVMNPEYWTYRERSLISDNFNISALRLYVWEWNGDGQTNSFYVCYDDLVKILGEIQTLVS